jgi:hypothetical protein
MSCKDRGHKKGIADDVSDHCVNEATLKIMMVTIQNSVKKGCFGSWIAMLSTQIVVDDDEFL